MKGYCVVGSERLKRKRKSTVVFVGGLKETAREAFEDIKSIVESDLKGKNACEVTAFFIAGNAVWRDNERTVDYSVRVVGDDGSFSDMILMDM